jgi:hypothetical protein
MGHNSHMSRQRIHQLQSMHFEDIKPEHVQEWRSLTGHSHESSLSHALGNWQHFGEIVGDTDIEAASQKLAMKDELDKNARPNDRVLYRGTKSSPTEEHLLNYRADNRPTGLSFTENKHQADRFGRSNMGSLANEPQRVVVARKGTVKGIRLKDYDIEEPEASDRKASDFRGEREWLVHPESLLFLDRRTQGLRKRK